MRTAAESIRAARPADEPAVLELLRAADLPTVEVDRWLPYFVIAERDGGIVGVAGMEVHGGDGILRSVAVDPVARGGGLGQRLTERVIAAARDAGLHRLYLLTTTAEAFFPRHGFRRIPREEASPEAQRSVEFREACPASAAVMVLELGAGGG